MRPASLSLVFCLTLIGCLSACRSAPEQAAETAAPPSLATRADSVAWGIYRSVGGPDVWDHVPLVRYDFRSENPADTVRRPARRHLWDRSSGSYRLEMTRGDSSIVVLFNTGSRAGTVYVNGTATADTSFQRRTLERAYSAFINDMYWTLMPTKLFDPGVMRTYVPDSSNAERDVIEVAFQNVGLTPGDHYWLYVDRASGQLQGWRYRLENMDAPGDFIAWTDWQTLQTPHGTAKIAGRHAFPSGRAILSENLALPDTVRRALFTDPAASME